MHFVVGIVSIVLLFSIGQTLTRAIVFFVIITGTLLINAKIQGKKIGFVNWFVEKFERKNVLFPGFGSATYALGVLIPLILLDNVNEIAAIIFILAVGDGISTIAGRPGKIKLPYNNKKTAEGTAAFFLSSLPAWLFIGEAIVIVAALSAIAESLPLKFDDNLTVPIVATAILLL